METLTAVTLLAQLARMQVEDDEDLDSFFIRGQELLKRLQEAGEAVSEDHSQTIEDQGVEECL